MTVYDRVALTSQAAAAWLERYVPQDEASGAMRKLGLLLAKRIEDRKPGPPRPGDGHGSLAAFSDLLFAERQELMSLLQGLRPEAVEAELSELLAALAISYARDGDVSMVAALVRASGQMGFSGPWLDDAVDFLEAQCCPAGAFGLLAIEADQLQRKSGESLDGCTLLRTTVEVLWALAAVFGAHRPVLQAR